MKQTHKRYATGCQGPQRSLATKHDLSGASISFLHRLMPFKQLPPDLLKTGQGEKLALSDLEFCHRNRDPARGGTLRAKPHEAELMSSKADSCQRSLSQPLPPWLWEGGSARLQRGYSGNLTGLLTFPGAGKEINGSSLHTLGFGVKNLSRVRWF